MNLFQSNRRRAIRMARMGIAAHIIALRLGLDMSELESDYGPAMRAAALKANLLVWETLFRMATSGRHPSATIFWLKTRAGAVPASTPKPPKASKEEAYCTEPPPPGAIRVLGKDGVVIDTNL